MALKKRLKEKIQDWKEEFLEHKELIYFSIFLLILATVIDYNAGKYVTRVGSSVVNDFILDNVPPINLNFLFVYAWLFLAVLLIVYPVFFRVHKIHTVLSYFSLLIIVRSFFITLTHLKTPFDAVSISFPGPLSFLQFENDLFFSGHTAVPFLGFLIFKEEKIRYIFLLGSIIMATTVLLMHQHYTIDVLSAYFITYGVHKIGKRLFSVIGKTQK